MFGKKCRKVAQEMSGEQEINQSEQFVRVKVNLMADYIGSLLGQVPVEKPKIESNFIEREMIASFLQRDMAYSRTQSSS